MCQWAWALSSHSVFWELIPSCNKPMSHSVFIMQWATVPHRHPPCSESVRRTVITLWRVSWWATQPVMQWANEFQELCRIQWVSAWSNRKPSGNLDQAVAHAVGLSHHEARGILYSTVHTRTNQYFSYPTCMTPQTWRPWVKSYILSVGYIQVCVKESLYIAGELSVVHIYK
jgi:hypothetical protein